MECKSAQKRIISKTIIVILSLFFIWVFLKILLDANSLVILPRGIYSIQNHGTGKYILVNDCNKVIKEQWLYDQKIESEGVQYFNIASSNGKSKISPICEKENQPPLINVNGYLVAQNSEVNLFSESGRNTQKWLFMRVSNIDNGYVIKSAANPIYVISSKTSFNLRMESYVENDKSQIWIIENRSK